ncbi:MAG TPA: cysteine-rich CWC family protein [Pseudolabrys sp.]|nr:cysteine-rich CWC family protein [Pseudolabrys sp.]
MIVATATTPRRLSCARCGTAFECGLSTDCWCAAEPYRLPMTKAWIEDCLCPTCLRKAAALADSRRTASENL